MNYSKAAIELFNRIPVSQYQEYYDELTTTTKIIKEALTLTDYCVVTAASKVTPSLKVQLADLADVWTMLDKSLWNIRYMSQYEGHFLAEEVHKLGKRIPLMSPIKLFAGTLGREVKVSAVFSDAVEVIEESGIRYYKLSIFKVAPNTNFCTIGKMSFDDYLSSNENLSVQAQGDGQIMLTGTMDGIETMYLIREGKLALRDSTSDYKLPAEALVKIGTRESVCNVDKWVKPFKNWPNRELLLNYSVTYANKKRDFLIRSNRPGSIPQLVNDELARLKIVGERKVLKGEMEIEFSSSIGYLNVHDDIEYAAGLHKGEIVVESVEGPYLRPYSDLIPVSSKEDHVTIGVNQYRIRKLKVVPDDRNAGTALSLVLLDGCPAIRYTLSNECDSCLLVSIVTKATYLLTNI